MSNDVLDFDGDSSFDHIATERCDLCAQKAPGVLFHSMGAPVLFVCKHCDASHFETRARADIDRWLSGGGF